MTQVGDCMGTATGHSRLSLPGAIMQVSVFVVSFSVDFVFLSSVMQEKQCGSGGTVDSIGLLVVKGVLVRVGGSKLTVCVHCTSHA